MGLDHILRGDEHFKIDAESVTGAVVYLRDSLDSGGIDVANRDVYYRAISQLENGKKDDVPLLLEAYRYKTSGGREGVVLLILDEGYNAQFVRVSVNDRRAGRILREFDVAVRSVVNWQAQDPRDLTRLIPISGMFVPLTEAGPHAAREILPADVIPSENATALVLRGDAYTLQVTVQVFDAQTNVSNELFLDLVRVIRGDLPSADTDAAATAEELNR